MEKVVLQGKRIINLTPHPITVVGEGDQRVTIDPAGHVARVGTVESPAGELILEGGLEAPLIKRAWGDVILPTPADVGVDDPTSVVLVVSSLVGEAIRAKGLPQEWEGATVVAPDTGPQSAVRDKDGRIIGVRRFVIYAAPTVGSSVSTFKQDFINYIKETLQGRTSVTAREVDQLIRDYLDATLTYYDDYQRAINDVGLGTIEEYLDGTGVECRNTRECIWLGLYLYLHDRVEEILKEMGIRVVSSSDLPEDWVRIDEYDLPEVVWIESYRDVLHIGKVKDRDVWVVCLDYIVTEHQASDECKFFRSEREAWKEYNELKDVIKDWR